jgi:hypothetical protein
MFLAFIVCSSLSRDGEQASRGEISRHTFPLSTMRREAAMMTSNHPIGCEFTVRPALVGSNQPFCRWPA